MNNVIIKARDGSQQVLKSVTGFYYLLKREKTSFIFGCFFARYFFGFDRAAGTLLSGAGF